ncbi:selenocysteine lyase/cysteine desulfurase [Natranaerovirga hydrolytica]|uniref:Selenocysteine lyase/cysteine desulfurase n=1 Tax=Natranaerovirga hydrolytica TaxID=680378 RepID=A0A4R1MYZ5_9FIRM|nr:aminotransferase class V-fold PLP-dependent enzyme [Natranaerovirga hydrolytica]TCK98476.1 selenocysteine lyase/cysteine desulfurase [Natranaerovirga hydrolytica]
MNHLIKYRHLVLGVDTKVPISSNEYIHSINFDNAATTPPIKPVLDAINNYSPWYASIHRGTSFKSNLSSSLYDHSREIVLDFVGGDLNDDTVIFVKNATEAINKLSYRLKQCTDKKIILTSYMEHHSNDLPWRDKYIVKYIDILENGLLDIIDLRRQLEHHKNKVALIAITGASNVTGFINDIYDIAHLAHQYGAKILVDGSQLVPHMPIAMKQKNPLKNIDFLVFSGHKMYAPFGVGALIGPKSFFDVGSSEIVGGGTVKVVTPNKVLWETTPLKDEAGTPNIMGIIALTASIRTLNRINLQRIFEHEIYLTNYTLIQMKKLQDIILYGAKNINENRVGIISFNITNMHHSIVAKALAHEFGISVRNGCFCAQPYVQKLLKIPSDIIQKSLNNPNISHPGLVRISFGFYNTLEEVDCLIAALKNIVNHKTTLIKKYG